MSWLLAFDDTDSPLGGCTTALAGPVLDAVGATGPPRLVRLNPASPWKTRGNAAVVIPVAGPASGEPRDVLEAAVAVIEAGVEDHERTSPGAAVFTTPPDPRWYELGVQTILDHEDAIPAAQRASAAWWGRRGGRGLVGALCAAAWRPALPSWESIAYRAAESVGTRRVVDAACLAELEAHPALFDCFDAGSGRPCMVPSTPCPVLYGLRGTQAAAVQTLAPTIPSEPVAWRTLFATNQASDDHLAVPGRVAAGTAGAFEAVVETRPAVVRGGHVIVPVRVGDEEARMVAFETTGPLRGVVRALGAGDRVLACGGVGMRDGLAQIHLEKLAVLTRVAHGPRPVCAGCGRGLGSAGATGPLRCRRCGVRCARAAGQRVADGRWHEVAPRARRHLARPLKLGLAPRLQACAASMSR